MALISRTALPTDTCLPSNLNVEAAADGLGCCEMDPQQFQAVKTYLLALIVKAVSNGSQDYTDWCDLAEALKSQDTLADWQRRAAYIEMLVKVALDQGVDSSLLGRVPIREAISCWCCSVSPQTMASMEIYLLCKLLALLQAEET